MLDDAQVHVKVRLAALWASVMSCYIYADYFALYSPGQLASMNRGIIPPFGEATDGVMIFVSAMLALPALMIFLSAALPAAPNRMLNLIAGALYTLIISATMWTSAHMIFYGLIEIALTLTAIFLAWRWPRTA
jgi:hypothetical protein